MLTGFMRNLLAIAYKMRLRGLVYQHLSREIYLEGYVNRTFLHNRSERESKVFWYESEKMRELNYFNI